MLPIVNAIVDRVVSELKEISATLRRIEDYLQERDKYDG